MNIEQLSELFFDSLGSESFRSELIEYCTLAIPRSSIADLYRIHLYVKDEEETIRHFKRMYCNYQLGDSSDDILYSSLKSLKILDENKSDLIALLSDIRLQGYNSNEENEIPQLIHPNQCDEAYLDLASGPDYIAYFNQFRENVKYITTDSSFFSHCCLSRLSISRKIPNFMSINEKLENIERNDIPEKITTVRAKNIGAYVQNGFGMIRKFASWIEASGALVFHEYWHALPYNEFVRNSEIIAKFTGCNIESTKEGEEKNPFCVHTAVMRKFN